MLISKEHDFVFVNNPASCRYDLQRSLYTKANFILSGVRKSPLSWERRLFDTDYLSIRDATQYGFLYLDEVKDIKNWITCVRDPIDRFVEAYALYIGTHRHILDVNDFIANYLSFSSIEFDWRFVYFRSQIESVKVPYQATYFILHEETLNDNWNHACRQIFGREVDCTQFYVREPQSEHHHFLDLIKKAVLGNSGSIEKLTMLYLEDYMTFMYKPMIPLESLKLPADYASRMEVIQRDAHRNVYFQSASNLSSLSSAERSMYDEIITLGGWPSHYKV